MPGTNSDYLPTMKNLSEKLGHKAVAIANAIPEEKTLNEAVVRATAISNAKEAMTGPKGKGTSKNKT